ncbi:glycerophosphodiester phosphodiesterase domain-containing protein 5 [Nerophis lumbriciformis]|uniref:glycerophosphodiester phosphodiesterase domain-containing protein 5 n=1 Tax=Nerophis lumbriciformis TaxID=546530 RepID=UPI002ADF143A|nr:glycerophosphodiester phosphodiesterase domain-containing protein 5-like [Nerophis lumbriciformis]
MLGDQVTRVQSALRAVHHKNQVQALMDAVLSPQSQQISRNSLRQRFRDVSEAAGSAPAVWGMCMFSFSPRWRSGSEQAATDAVCTNEGREINAAVESTPCLLPVLITRENESGVVEGVGLAIKIEYRCLGLQSACTLCALTSRSGKGTRGGTRSSHCGGCVRRGGKVATFCWKSCGARLSGTRLKLGKLKVVRRQLLQRYEHQPFVSCLAGLYGCQWRRYQRARAQPGECCCSKVECGSFGLLILTFFLSLVFLYFWIEAQNDYNDFDWFNFGTLGFWFPWSLVLLVVAAALFTYIALLLVLAVCLLSEGQRLYLHWSHKTGIIVTLVFSAIATAILSDLWSKEWTTLLLSLQVTAPVLHVAALSLMAIISWPIALHFFRMNNRARQVAVLGVFLSGLFSLYLVPLGMYSPCIKDSGTLGAAPMLIGHRGAPMLAPENTLMSFEKAVEAGGDGLETDVTISYDGVPFLMHDSTLRRTTNIAEVFPNRTYFDASMFTWAELQQLNAGDWFLSRDPFGTVSSLTEVDRNQAKNQSIPSLAQFLEVAARSGRQVLFDLRRPPFGHPYCHSYINTTLQVVLDHINSSQVLWLPSQDRELVQAVDPELQQTSGQRWSIQELLDGHITTLNLHYSSMSQEQISKYRSVNISTNLYVISQPWLYTLAWCAGAQSLTTNSIHILSNIDKPLFLMTPEEYTLMWILTDVVSAILIISIFIFHWWRERGLPFLSGSRQTHENGPYSKFRTELSDVWSISGVNVQPEQRSTPTLHPNPHLPTITEE